ncbi:MAG TPA: hypothetical protein VK501_24590 [Baekduia sp.]|uniref:hypothetical protein n=1 Tax=Baekduia sp. TaxID=2600305 RepID=UPI002CF842CA|nr:hypothetical protein [Baekduia sp.]HMJ37106.1 hypothetical protein [Baekduia sp.]
MRLSLKRLAPVTAVTAAAAACALIPAASASAAPAAFAVPSLPALPALPLSGAGLGSLPAFAFPATGFAGVPLTFQGPQVAIGPTVIGSVFNGGTSVVVSNDPPVASGNVIGSP